MGSKAARMERQARLRPMGPGEVVAAAFEVCQQSALSAFRASFGPVVAALACFVFITEVALPQALFTPRGQPVDQAAPILAVLIAGVVTIAVSAWVYSSVLDTVAPVAAAFVTGEEPPQRRSTFPTALLGSLLLFGPLFSGLFLVFLSDIALSNKPGLQATIGVLGLLSFGFYGLVWLFGLQAVSIAPVAARVEGTGALRSLGRGFVLGKRNIRAPGGAMALMALFLAVLGVTGASGGLVLYSVIPVDSLAGTPIGPDGAASLASLLSLLPFLAATLPVPPLWASCAVVTYYSRRVAVEGYDIDVVAREVGMLRDQSL